MPRKDSDKNLTEGQVACLRLVAQHHTSKEIARKLSISPFTVDQRLDAARKKLGSSSRKEAAQIFMEIEAGKIPERLVYEPQAIAATANSASLTIPTSDRRYRGGRDGSVDDPVSNHAGLLKSLVSIIKVPPIGGERHNHTNRVIMLQAVNVAFYAAIMVGIIAIILTVAMKVLS